MTQEQVIDDKDFVDVQDAVEILTDWVTASGGPNRGVRLVCGDGTTFSRVVLIERRLSDGSVVHDVRLS